MDIVKKEIRQALLGDLVPMDNKLVVSGRRMAKFRYGLRDGIGNVLFLGVMCRKRWYMTKKSRKQIREMTVKAMQDMGRMVGLKSSPEIEAVYCAYLLNNPAILTFTQGTDGVIEITAYSGRGINGLIATFRTLNRFQKAMQNVMSRMSETGELNRWNEIRQQEVQDKQDQKLAKKKKKQEKKQAREQRIKQQMPQQSDRQEQQTNHVQKAGSFVQRLAGKLSQKQSAAQIEADARGAIEGKIGITEKMSAQERLAVERAELEEAKLAAEEAAMKLAAAEARLAAQEAEAKLAEVQARLAEAQTGETEEAKQSANPTDTACEGAEPEGAEPEGTEPDRAEPDKIRRNSNKKDGGNRNSSSRNSRNSRNRKKKH